MQGDLGCFERRLWIKCIIIIIFKDEHDTQFSQRSSRLAVSLLRRVFPVGCRHFPLTSCRSLLEHKACFARPWRLNNRQLSRLIRLLGLYCHRGWADKWSDQGCCCPSSMALKGIITDILISIYHTWRWTERDMKRAHRHTYQEISVIWSEFSNIHQVIVPLQDSHLDIPPNYTFLHFLQDWCTFLIN